MVEKGRDRRGILGERSTSVPRTRSPAITGGY